MVKRIFSSILIAVAISFGFSCRSKTVVKKLVSQNANISNKSETKKIDGVMYHLPKTIVQVTVPVNKVSKTPGEFAEFAPCFFSASEREDMINEPSQKFSAGQPSFSSRGIPDTSETYVISTKGKYFESKSLFVEYAPGYVLTKGEAESKNETLEFTAKAIVTAASIAAKIVPLALSTTDSEKKEQLAALGKEYNCLNSIKADALATRQKIKVEKQADLATKVAALAGGAPDTPEITALRAKIVELDAQISAINASIIDVSADIHQLIALPTPQPDENTVKNPNEFRNRYQTALGLYTNLLALISQRDGALAISQPAPAETYKQQLEKNAEAIAAHRAAFLGITSKETWAATLEFEPQKGGNEYSPLLFTYSKTKGVCNNGELKDKSIPISPAFRFSGSNEELCGDTTETKVQALWLKVIKSPNQAYLDDVYAANLNAALIDKSRGWFYRIPANGVVTMQTQDFNCQPKPAVGGVVKNSCLINSLTFNGTITATFEGIAAPIPSIANNSTQFARNEMLVAQLGVVASVPASTAGRSSVTAIMLDPTTGAMKNYKSSSLPLVDKAILDDAQKAANSTIDAVDPLNRKKRELEELKTQNDINEQKKKLANANTGNNQ